MQVQGALGAWACIIWVGPSPHVHRAEQRQRLSWSWKCRLLCAGGNQQGIGLWCHTCCLQRLKLRLRSLLLFLRTLRLGQVLLWLLLLLLLSGQPCDTDNCQRQHTRRGGSTCSDQPRRRRTGVVCVARHAVADG